MFYEPYDDRHPVARAIRTGTPWFGAWQFQCCQPTPRLARHTRIPVERINELERGAPITRAEFELLAEVYCVYPADIIASVPDTALMVED